MTAMLADLVQVRSQLAWALQDYFQRVIAAPDARHNIPAYLGDHTLTALYVEPDVLKRERQKVDVWESHRMQEQERGNTGAEERLDERKRSHEARRENIAPEARDVGESALYGEREHETERRVAWAQELKEIERGQARCAVVLAPPGQGKSLLTQMTTRSLTEAAWRDLNEQRVEINALPLPIVVPLKALTDKVIPPGTSPDEALRLALTAALRENLAGYPELAINYLAAHVHERRCWLFLDALDEADIEAALDRITVLEQWQCRVILTSRPYGYEGQRLPFDVTEYRLAPLTATQARTFVDKWFGSGARHARMAELLTRSLSVQRMSQSPFLLTLLCWVAERHDLTEDITRTQLHDRIVRDLLGLPPSGRGKVDDKRATDLLPLITEVAFASFQENAGRKPISTERLLDVMEASPKRPAPLGLTADDLVRLNPRERAGFLLEELEQKRLLVPYNQNRDTYIFPHRSILEYLAACSLAGVVNDSGGKWESKIQAAGKKWSVRAFVDKKAWRADHEETICFLAGKLNDPAPLLEILSNPKPTLTNPYGDDWLRHRLALAAQCLPEAQRSINGWQVAIIDQITTDVFSLWWEHQGRGSGMTVLHLTRALPALGQSKGQMLHRRVASQLRKRIRSISENGENRIGLLEFIDELMRDSDRGVREAATEVVGNIGVAAATPLILVHLTEWLRYPTNRDVCFDRVMHSAAARALGRMGSVPPNILACLAEQLRNPSWDVLGVAQCALKEIGEAAASPEFLAHLAELLRDPSWEVRDAAWHAVLNIGVAAATPEFLACLAEQLRDPDGSARYVAASIVGAMGAVAATPEILSRLAELLRDPSEKVRNAAVHAIGRIGTAAASSEFLARLAELLRDPDGNVGDAVRAVGKIGAAAAIPEILACLAELLRNPRWCSKAAGAIREMGAAAATSEILAVLTELLLNPFWFMRSGAADAIQGVGMAASPEVLDRFAKLLRDPEWEIRCMAAETVRKMGAAAATPEILACLAGLLRDPKRSVRDEAAGAVGEIGAAAATPKILSRLAELLRDPNDLTVYSAPVRALARLVKDDVRVFKIRSVRTFWTKKFVARSVEELSQ